MDQPIFYEDAFIAQLNRNELNRAYQILRSSYQIIYEEIQTNGPITSVAMLKQKTDEKTQLVSQMCAQATQQSEQLTVQLEEQEKSIPDLQQMFELSQRKMAESTQVLKAQVKQQKEENALLKQMYTKIQAGQEDEFAEILDEATQPLEAQKAELAAQKDVLAKEVDELKQTLGNKDALERIEDEHQHAKQQLENDIKTVQAKLSAQNASVQRQQQELDAVSREAQQLDAVIQQLNDEMIKRDTEIKKLSARLDGCSVDSYA